VARDPGLIGMFAAVLVFHSLIAKPFYIPSASMLPGLWVGDHLVVSKYPYGWNWASPSFHILPRGDWRILPHTPDYGDVVIIVPRGRPDEDYIKRVALPGDRIALRNGQIILNGRPVPQAVEPPAEIPLDAIRSDEDPSLRGLGLCRAEGAQAFGQGGVRGARLARNPAQRRHLHHP
jgi:signal peptidase I